jgi:hypothetical protein
MTVLAHKGNAGFPPDIIGLHDIDEDKAGRRIPVQATAP